MRCTLLPTSLLLLAASVPATATTFSGLGPDDRVGITIESSGCFHRFMLEAEIFGGAQPRSEVTLPKERPDAPETRRVRDLSAQDLAALDEYTRILRENEQIGYCTTQETFVLRWYSSEELVYEEQLKDSSCAAMENIFRPGVSILGFTELAYPPPDARRDDVSSDEAWQPPR